jgi:hypothetical protein
MYLHIYQPGVVEVAQRLAVDPWSYAKWIVAFETPKFHLLQEMQNWCCDTYGPENNTRWRDEIRWGEVWFRNESDVVMFSMRWS